MFSSGWIIFFLIWKHVSIYFKTTIYSSVTPLCNTAHWFSLVGASVR